ncbi:BnaA10g13080D [Brassica napus]|uniref:BnaA10g13080D protein n=1 Tax=Brassica napus TaxID=3708 RepID=A0A078H422_BRANA|nr:BnaA10g13080D [Brassica napus]
MIRGALLGIISMTYCSAP